MAERSFERLYGRSLTLDLCLQCQGIWFDRQELLQLSPSATIDLVAAIHDASAEARQVLGPRLKCPRCVRTLSEARDLQRNTRFTFFSCPAGHGRFLTFYQFLRAKNFVRSLDAREIDRLRTHLRQVNCSNCGAPVDVERGAACTFCRTPLAILDPDQVRTALEQLASDANRRTPDATLPVTLLLERLRAERAFAEATGNQPLDALLSRDTTDLVGAGLRAVARLLRWRPGSA
jgi:hypothetical protein